jgi:DNA mismatch repair protein PMS2
VTTCLASDAPKGSKLEFETSGKLRGTSVVAAQKGTTVTVEGLFNNLPVRRRELERNIKKEWNRVIGVLNQYACILTGVKFSVSQQPNKGKKIVLFSTKGNNTTRDNIVNVFGAKTLTVLITLDLELELEPTGLPGQRQSIQDDAGTKEIKVKGHVSRPAHGEGRQTPDRQMFFVNGRPCGLPQFAKVFNEVYKSYNSSQSPFIFADIQLDTHMYDVNVSPDKRTILLHDQSRLLDNLRESLVALFEAQDYSVPLSSLGAPKQTPFKKPTISRQGTIESDTSIGAVSVPSSVDKARTNGGSQDNELLLEDATSDTEGQQDDDEGTHRRESGSRKSVAQADQGHNLVSKWVERKSDGRQHSGMRGSPPALATREKEVSKSQEKLISKFTHAKKRTNEEGLSDEILEETAESPSQVTDFSTRLAELSSDTQEPELSEPPIPSISAPSRVSDVKTVVLSPPRFKRTAPGIATITIGDETITSVIGSPAKKTRIGKSKERDTPKSHGPMKKTTHIPSFKGRLTQMFSASSTSNIHSGGIEVTRELVDSPDRSRSSSEDLFMEDGEDEDIHATGPTPDADGEDAEEQDSILPTLSPASNCEEVGEEEDNEGLLLSQPSDDEDYMDEDEKKAQEEDKVQFMIGAAEDAAKTSSEETQKRQQSFVKGGSKRKDATFQLLQRHRLNLRGLRTAVSALERTLVESASNGDGILPVDDINAVDAEERLSLTISKSDFGKMKVVGQFNLGFIIAIRAAQTNPEDIEDIHAVEDELFIIDQHATDEKYNFERLQASTIVQSQRLVQPKTLELTAIEEEVIKENLDALESNGFMLSIDESGYQPVGSRCQLLSLPLSRETTFSLADLEELISLLADHQATSENTIPRPSKVRKMFAMRACRSSVMIGKSLPNKQMEKLVRHMGELDKPWNCPHGRPTMRHLCGLGAWNESGWKEGDDIDGERGEPTDWAKYMKDKREA